MHKIALGRNPPSSLVCNSSQIKYGNMRELSDCLRGLAGAQPSSAAAHSAYLPAFGAVIFWTSHEHMQMLVNPVIDLRVQTGKQA